MKVHSYTHFITSRTILLIIIWMLVFSSFTIAATVELDPAFGNSAGKNTTSFGGFSDEAAADTAIQPDGKIVTVGSRNNNNDINTAIVRYRADGTLDTSFNGSGIIINSFSTSNDAATAVAIQPDGKIVVGGSMTNVGTTGGDFMLLRYNSDGTLDQSFNGTGIVWTDILNNSRDEITDVLIQPDGKIVAVGYLAGGWAEMAFVRYNTNGTLDTTFGTDGTGKIITPFGTFDDFATEVALQSDGKIVIGGSSGGGSINRLTIIRLNPNGTYDTTFDGDGILKYNGLPPDLVAVSVMVQPDNKIIAAMSTNPNVNNSNFSIVRFNSDGSNDTAFGTGGIATYDAGGVNLSDELRDAILLPDGKILVAGGSVFPPFNKNFSIIRLNSDGSLDTSYGIGGRSITVVTGIVDTIYEMVLQPDNKVVVGGVSMGDATSRDFTVARFQENGKLDPRFGEVGLVHTPVRNDLDEVRDLARQSDGKIVAAGTSRLGIAYNCALVRYNANGTVDSSFGSQGKVVTSLTSGDDGIYSITIQPDGKILATGYAGGEGNNGDWAILRYNANGTPDTSFNGNGRIIVNLGGSTDVGRAILVQPDGKILVGGYSFIASTGNFTILRYNANGTPDTTFDGDGVANTTINDRTGYARGMVLQPDGKIVLAGDYVGPDYRDFAVVRFNSNGSLDTDFGSGGKVITSVGANNDEAEDVALTPDGKIVVVGATTNGAVGDFAVVRYNSNGSLDTTFDDDGKAITPINNNDKANSVVVQPNGKIIAAGYSTDPSNSNFDYTLVRYNANGSLDNTFGAGGKIVTDYGRLGENAYSVILEPNGNIIIGGAINKNGLREFALIRYLNLTPSVLDFDGDGKSDVSVYRPSAGAWYLNQSSAGFSAVNFGIASDILTPADYDGDGKTDVAVFRDGNWYLLRSQAGFTAVSFGQAGDIPVPADYNGDGKAEVAVYRSGNWYILNLVNGEFSAVSFGASSDKPVTGDFDGDGKVDQAVFRGSEGYWYLNTSSQGVKAVSFGIVTDKLVAADYDGDGKTDIAVLRDGNWYRLNSSNNQFVAVQFGISTDLAVPADYDGDGKADVAVFRNGNWYILQSTNGFTATAFGLGSDQPLPNVFVR